LGWGKSKKTCQTAPTNADTTIKAHGATNTGRTGVIPEKRESR